MMQPREHQIPLRWLHSVDKSIGSFVEFIPPGGRSRDGENRGMTGRIYVAPETNQKGFLELLSDW